MEKNYIFSYETDMSHYTAQAFVVRCFDDRFREVFGKFRIAQGIEHLDPESVAGGGKIFSSPEKENDRDFMFRELEKSIRLHHTEKIMLFTHEDCGAYGGNSRFANDPEAEFQFHISEHEKARDALKSRFPDIPIETYYMDQHGIIKT